MIRKVIQRKDRLQYEEEQNEGQAPTPPIFVQENWHFRLRLEVVTTDAHMHQELFRIRTNRDAVGIYGIRIRRAI